MEIVPADIPGGDVASLRAMLRAARSAVHRGGGRTRERFLRDADVCNAVLHRLERIQDLSRCVSEATRLVLVDLPWTRLDTMRERTRRIVDVGGVTALDEGILWDILSGEIPTLIEALQRALPEN